MHRQLKILVIVPSWHYYADPIKHQPFWELYYATHVREAGYDVDIVDLRMSNDESFENMAAGIPDADFYFYWIFKTGDAVEVYSIVDFLKKRLPKSIHAAGGTHVDKTQEEAKLKLDSIVVGPGERAFNKIIEDESKGTRKVVYESSYKEVLFANTLIPNRNFLPYDSVVNNKLFTGYGDIKGTLTYFSRGCVYKCAFCTYNVPNQLQVRTPDQIKEEINYLKSNYGVQGLLVKDEVALHPSKNICHPTLKAIEDCGIVWRGQTTTKVDLETLQRARDSGCLELAIGVETADEEVMKIIDKRWQDRDQIIRFAENARRVGIKVKICLILGLPGEPEDIVEKTINLLEELDPDYASVSGFLPVPGSPIADNPKKFGIKTIDKDWHKYSHLLYRFADSEEVGLPFEYDLSENSMNIFSREEIKDNIQLVQNWLRERGKIY